MDGGIFALLAVLGIFIFVFAIIGIVLYVVGAMGLYKLAQNAQIDNAWLAWIPIANLYILGRLIKTLKISTYDIPSIELVLPIGAIVIGILNRVPLLGVLANIAYLVLTLFALHKLYSMYRPKDATLWLVLGIILPFLIPIFLFMMRNDTPVNC